MSTRKTNDVTTFHQHRFASSADYERGLLGNLVAKRTALLERRENRELIWAVQYLSHQEGGLAAVARDLLAKYSERIATREMLAIKKPAAQNYSADEIRAIRLDLPASLRSRFPLKGETSSAVRELRTKYSRLASTAERYRALRAAAEDYCFASDGLEDTFTAERDRRERAEREQAAKHPASYPASKFRELCMRAAVEGIEAYSDYPATASLERTLSEMCLDPQWDFAAGPWYFPGLVQALREYVSEWCAARCNWPETKLGRIIADEFDYTWHGRCMSLLTGESRRGKSFAAKICCLKNIGRARFVEVPPGNDDTSFFRALARGLGLGNLGQYSTVDIKDRVETLLLTGDILLVLDESQRLFPERTRYAYPCRITWLMTMANAKVPILMISTPQFISGQRMAEKSGWNSAQLTGRIFNYKVLPSDLEKSDLMAVCRAVLPEASETVLGVLAEYARMSARYLSAVESIAMRARYLAGRAGRQECSNEDVRVAMNESVVPSDTALNSLLEKSRAEASRRRLPRMEPSAPEALAGAPVARTAGPSLTPVSQPRANITEFSTA